MDRKKQARERPPTNGGADSSKEVSAQGLTVYLLGDRAPVWSGWPGITCHLLGSDLGTEALMGLLDKADSTVVLMDAALLTEADPAWLWSVQSALGPVVSLGEAATESSGALLSRVSGSLPRTFLDVPGDVALAVLRHFATASPTGAAEMERFMRDAIHEFRTPLTVMKEFTSLCEDGVGGPLTEKQRGYLAYIQSAGKRLCREFDDYRDALRMHLGALRFGADSVPLLDVMLTVAETSDEFIEMDCQVPRDVLLDDIDATRVVESIHRVILAAKKLHRDNGPLGVNVTSEGSTHEIAVAFRGVEPAAVDVRVLEIGQVELEGSPRRSITRVFGLGMAMGQLFLRNCGGNIRLEPLAEEGGRFVVSIPTRQEAARVVEAA